MILVLVKLMLYKKRGVQVHDLKKHVFDLGTKCNENPIYVFPEKELRDLSTNFYINVSVSDLDNPRIGPHIFLQQNRQTNRGNM
jgi:hypothetical protein